MSNGLSNQTYCRCPFLEHHIYQNSEKMMVRRNSVTCQHLCFPKYFSLTCPKNQSKNRIQNERPIWALRSSVLV